MTGPSPAVAATRVAVRATLSELSGSGGLVLVACSGGADSLALAAAAAFEAPRAGMRAGAVVVDHGLQPGSDAVAREAAATCADLGLDPVVRVRIEVAPTDAGGPEAAARDARYTAVTDAAATHDAVAVLLGHTRHDQAEQVLLGLARGSGTRSLAGMPSARGLFRRPLLDLPAQTTRQACEDLGLTPWQDPHNDDDRYLRVRARKLMATLEAELGPGVVAALARSAALARIDADALDALAENAIAELGEPPWEVAEFAALHDAIRGRVWRLLARDAGVPLGSLSHRHVAEADRLLTDYRGQGPISWPGGHEVARRGRAVVVVPPVAACDPAPFD
ncbi:MAG: tRNA lysidine(34) synthetase TilS [Dermatophilus congolensis]|nr:tRNA lysidine(34) synthetase TilS [Dermatophilus congolensis]